MITELKIEKEYEGGKFFEVLVTAKDKGNKSSYTFKATYSKRCLEQDQLKLKIILAGASEDDVEELQSMSYSEGYDAGYENNFGDNS